MYKPRLIQDEIICQGTAYFGIHFLYLCSLLTSGCTIALNNYVDITMFETCKESMYVQKPPTILKILQSPSGLKKPVALVGRSFVDLILHKKTKI